MSVMFDMLTPESWFDSSPCNQTTKHSVPMAFCKQMKEKAKGGSVLDTSFDAKGDIGLGMMANGETLVTV